MTQSCARKCLMLDVIHLPPFQTPAKPKRGEPCNGCGLCCHLEVCAIGKYAFPDSPAPCPAIAYVDGMVRCGLVLMEQAVIRQDGDVKPLIQEMLGTGRGCDADDPDLCD